MSDFILAVSVILIFAFVLWFLKKINYFLGEDRKIIDREPDDEDKEILVSGRFLNKKGKDQMIGERYIWRVHGL